MPHRPNIKHDVHLSPIQADFVAATGEFVGTFWFPFFAYAGQLMVLDQAATTPGASVTMYASFACYVVKFLADMTLDGFSLLVTVWSMYRISGRFFNPAVTFGLSLSGRLPWLRTAIFTPSQLIACICAGAVVKVLFPGNIASLNTTLAPGVNVAQGLFAEMFFTSHLVFVVLILAVEKSRDTFIAPIGIGLALFVAEIPGIYYTGGSLNPARSFGCAVAAPQFPGYHWIYWVGPALGATLASGYYRFVKMLHYEVNPGQDASTFDITTERIDGVNDV
ncbi:aquaporin-like protein [Xylaria digitata]|nr:aquaporin-like protein [Xylaria digitata]